MKRRPAWIWLVFLYMEVWRDIKGYEECYQVSSLGRVKSLKRKGVLTEKILKNNIAPNGYYYVILSSNGKGKIKRIHKLVAIMFLGHHPNGYETIIDHIDNNKLNNSVSNLQITTSRHNTSKDRKGGTSRYVGVSWSKQDCKWRAEINIKGRNKFLGRFTCELEASEAYQKELKKINS